MPCLQYICIILYCHYKTKGHQNKPQAPRILPHWDRPHPVLKFIGLALIALPRFVYFQEMFLRSAMWPMGLLFWGNVAEYCHLIFFILMHIISVEISQRVPFLMTLNRPDCGRIYLRYQLAQSRICLNHNQDRERDPNLSAYAILEDMRPL